MKKYFFYDTPFLKPLRKKNRKYFQKPHLNSRVSLLLSHFVEVLAENTFNLQI